MKENELISFVIVTLMIMITIGISGYVMWSFFNNLSDYDEFCQQCGYSKSTDVQNRENFIIEGLIECDSEYIIEVELKQDWSINKWGDIEYGKKIPEVDCDAREFYWGNFPRNVLDE